jgi:predicted O-linked N-acetylglucosamine transferase (SPINDLY family)
LHFALVAEPVPAADNLRHRGEVAVTDVTAAFAAAVAKHQQGDFAGAEAGYRGVLQAVPSHAPALCNLGVLLARTGQTQAAADCYNLALAGTPGYPDAHFNLGNLHRRAEQYQAAADNYLACLTSNPDHAAAAYNLGLVLSAAGRATEAASWFETVVRLEPHNADAHSRLGDCHMRTGKLLQGVAHFRMAVELKPADPRGQYNLGLALSNAGDTSAAHECLRKALDLHPDYPEAHNALGLNLEALCRKDDAMFHYQKSVELKPDLADGWSNLGVNLTEQGRVEEALACLRESLVHRPNAAPIHSNLLLLLNYSSNATPADVRDEHLAWGKRFGGTTPPRPGIPEPHDPNRPMRIGYLSADFRTHTVAGFIELLLRHHDRERVEVYAYAQVPRPDDTTERLKSLADHWRPVAALTDHALADQIRNDRIDCLIDLSGHTAGNRLLTLAERPAPIQATLFGYPNTTGLAAVDFRITDPVSDPPGAEELYAEGLLHLPETAWAYLPPADAPAVTPLPAAGRRTFTFGCLNNAAKISDKCLDTWVTLLQTTPGTRLVVLGGQSQTGARRLTERFLAAGVFRDRIEVVMRLPRSEYFEAYQMFDLSLDPFPYNGGVTTGDSLWMGVPVLTVEGNTYHSRQGAMVMRHLGLGEFVAGSPADLIKLAQGWTRKRPALADIRAGLRDRLAASPLCDSPRYVRHLEGALRREWEKRL